MYCWRTPLSCSASLRAVHWFDAVFLCINTFNLPISPSPSLHCRYLHLSFSTPPSTLQFLTCSIPLPSFVTQTLPCSFLATLTCGLSGSSLSSANYLNCCSQFQYSQTLNARYRDVLHFLCFFSNLSSPVNQSFLQWRCCSSAPPESQSAVNVPDAEESKWKKKHSCSLIPQLSRIYYVSEGVRGCVTSENADSASPLGSLLCGEEKDETACTVLSFGKMRKRQKRRDLPNESVWEGGGLGRRRHIHVLGGIAKREKGENTGKKV